MYLHERIKEKFINEAADCIIDSLDNYSEYINENRDFQYYTELVAYHLIGYRVCENYLTDDRKLSAFDLIGDYVNDYTDMFGEAPKDINSEYVFQFYFDTYLNQLANEMECAELFKDGELIYKDAVEFIEYWRAQEIAELYKF